MSPTKVKQKCVECGVVFERSKFNPYLDKCEKHRANKEKKSKQTNKQVVNKQAKQAVNVVNKQVNKVVEQALILPLPSVTNFKKVIVTVEKEKIFIHLLSRGWKLSFSNKLYKNIDKVKVVATLGGDGSPSQKFSASFWGGGSFNGFDGSMSIVEKSQLKKLPTEITDDLEDILNLIWPEEEIDAK